MKATTMKKTVIGGKKKAETKTKTATPNKTKKDVKAKEVTKKKDTPNRGRKAGFKKVVTDKDIKKLDNLFNECAEMFENMEEPLNIFKVDGKQKSARDARLIAGELRKKITEMWRFIHEAKKNMKEVKVDKSK